MKTIAAILLAIALIQFGEAEERVDQAIYKIFGDHMAGEKIPEKRVYEAMEQIVLTNFEVDGDLKAAVAEINRQYPRLFISFGASEALHANMPKVKISEKKIGLKWPSAQLAVWRAMARARLAASAATSREPPATQSG
jgi:hypothetical protein